MAFSSKRLLCLYLFCAFCNYGHTFVASQRLKHENSCEIGVFSLLTNAYCLVPNNSPATFRSVFQEQLAKFIPVVEASIAGVRIVGSMCAGNKNGLIVPYNTTDQELQHLRNSLPDKVVVQRIEERLTALGNCVACNDSVAIVHSDYSKETEEIIADVLNVETFKFNIVDNINPGSCSTLTNQGCLVHPGSKAEIMDELSTLLQVCVVPGTVNCGNTFVGSGMVANDWIGFCGNDTTVIELNVIDHTFKLSPDQPNAVLLNDMRKSMIDTYV